MLEGTDFLHLAGGIAIRHHDWDALAVVCRLLAKTETLFLQPHFPLSQKLLAALSSDDLTDAEKRRCMTSLMDYLVDTGYYQFNDVFERDLLPFFELVYSDI